MNKFKVYVLRGRLYMTDVTRFVAFLRPPFPLYTFRHKIVYPQIYMKSQMLNPSPLTYFTNCTRKNETIFSL